MHHSFIRKFDRILKCKPLGQALSGSVLLTLITAASANGEATSSILAPADVSAVHQICSDTMRAWPGDADFNECVSSLSDTLAEEVRAVQLRQYKAACEQKGLSTNTTAYDVCVADQESRSETADGKGAERIVSEPLSKISDADSDRFPTNAGSPPRVRDRREKLSCAQLGLEPGSNTFAHCVNELDTALFATDHPI